MARDLMTEAFVCKHETNTRMQFRLVLADEGWLKLYCASYLLRTPYASNSVRGFSTYSYMRKGCF